jgi:hypothetical protein
MFAQPSEIIRSSAYDLPGIPGGFITATSRGHNFISLFHLTLQTILYAKIPNEPSIFRGNPIRKISGRSRDPFLDVHCQVNLCSEHFITLLVTNRVICNRMGMPTVSYGASKNGTIGWPEGAA